MNLVSSLQRKMFLHTSENDQQVLKQHKNVQMVFSFYSEKVLKFRRVRDNWRAWTT